jgi:YbbR domain-containing protein
MLSRNLGLKATAIVVAIFIWGYVQLQGSESFLARVLRNVAVEPVGAASDIECSVRPPSVQCQLRGSRAEIEMLSPGDVRAWVRLRKGRLGTYRARVLVTAPEGIEAIASPESVSVVVWMPVSRFLEVGCDFMGRPAPGYEVEETAVAPGAVEVKGKTEVVKRVWRVRVRVPIEGARRLVSSTIAPEALDRDGHAVRGLSISPGTVTATVSIRQQRSARTVPVLLRTTGSLPQGLRIQSVELQPPMVTIVGSPQALEEVTGIATSPLDLKGLEGDVERTLSLVVPAGLNVVETREVAAKLRVVRAEAEEKAQPERESAAGKP